MSHLLDDLEHSLLEGSPDEFDSHDGDKEQRRSVLEKHLARLDDIEQDFEHCRKQWWLFTKTLHSGPQCPQSMYAHTGPYVLQWSRSARDEWKMYMARAVEYDYWERLERHRTEYRQELEDLDLTQAERNARDALFLAQVQARILSMRNNNRAQRALPVISQACTPHSEPGGTTTAEVLARSNHESTPNPDVYPVPRTPTVTTPVNSQVVVTTQSGPIEDAVSRVFLTTADNGSAPSVDNPAFTGGQLPVGGRH
ncbi:hypothetical protein AAVH_22164 [Aphelenchoides avenae]|nr:hypothetical protein AAVH_22164 [Aphelenchus avenae]